MISIMHKCKRVRQTQKQPEADTPCCGTQTTRQPPRANSCPAAQTQLADEKIQKGQASETADFYEVSEHFPYKQFCATR